MKVYITNVAVTGRCAVGNSPGYELSSDQGTSRVAWNQGSLITDCAASAQFLPPLPLLSREKEAKWQGWVIRGHQRRPAKATITRAPSAVTVLGQSRNGVLGTVTIKVGPDEFVLQTWFLSGIGIAQQQQYHNGVLSQTMQLMSQSRH